MMRNLVGRPVLLVAASFLCVNAFAALPAIPGAAGFGIDTPAGRGGKIFRVTNLEASGPGSLTECVAASGPRICVFDVSGVIRLTSNLSVRNPYLTIAGQTAPAPGIMIGGAGLGIHASNVLVQHITVRPGDDPLGPPVGSRDALKITASAGTSIRNVVVDHCTFSWSIDEVMEVWGDVDNVTLSNNMFTEPLDDSLHEKGPHGYAALTGGGSGRVAYIGNLFAHGKDRNPRTGAGQFVLVNNVVYNYMATGAHLFNEGKATLNSLVGNVYLKGPNSYTKAATIRLSGDPRPLVSGTRIFLQDNVGHRPDGTLGTDDPWSIVRNDGTLSRAAMEADSPPIWPSSLVARPSGKDEALNHVLANAGSRPAQRSTVDARVISSVKNRTGRIINCVADNGTTTCAANGGGWPNYARNTRMLSLPTNPNGDEDGDGYTNVEEWLHDYAAEVEGRALESKPNPPVIDVN